MSSGLNYSKLQFPSDLLTIGKIRSFNNNKDFFYEGRMPEKLPGTAIYHLQEMLKKERLVAAVAFEQRGGVHQPNSIASLIVEQETIRQLNDLYRYFGITRGEKETNRLVRSIETQARDQSITCKKR